jgi:hypothetical protein
MATTTLSPNIPTGSGGTPGLPSQAVIPPDVTDTAFNQPSYNFSSKIFPANLGEQSYNGHYMIININVPNGSNFEFVNGNRIFNALSGQSSKLDILRYQLDKSFFGTGGVALSPGNSFTRQSNTTRIAESIALFMPSAQLNFTSLNEYTDVSLTSFTADLAKAGIAIVGEVFGGAVGAAINKFVSGPLAGVGQIVSDVAQLTGNPINPKIEVVFSKTALREFVFEFLMYPTTPAESDTIKEIVKTLRFHAAPELNPATKGLTYIPPANFDITFYNRGQENTNIPRINTCVLEQIDVNYAPTALWSTFYNGQPHAVQMVLRFRELEVVHKLRVIQGF